MNLEELISSKMTIYMLGSLVIFFAFILLIKLRSKSSVDTEKNKITLSKQTQSVNVLKPLWSQRLADGLSISRSQVWGKIGQLFAGEVPALDEVEETLYTADISTDMVQQLLERLGKEGKGKSADEIQHLVYGFMKEKMLPAQEKIRQDIFTFNKAERKTRVLMIVGVNGAGKTTTIGKLATKLKSQDAKVIVGACDTFRAAAVDQLQVWCDRAGVDMVRAKDGADPSGVAYDTVAKAFSENYDYCLIDTAGRLHTNQNLMDELTKTKRVMSKIDAGSPHEVLLVLDAITGQNALKQAQEFNKALQLTGIIFTKCDGSAKAGSALSIVDQLQVPIAYIGVGESVDDLHLFDLDQYLKTLVGIEAT